MPPIPYAPSREFRLNAVLHVVYEYANLVSSGHYSMHGDRPWRNHCDDAFLLGCRKMDDFLMKPKRSTPCDGKKELDDVLALDYLADGVAVTWTLPLWTTEWRGPMNKQLAHIAYTRDKSWDHTRWVHRLLPEFKTAWSLFLGAIVDQEYRDTFAEHLRLKQYLIDLA